MATHIGVTLEYGRYLGTSCIGCHGATLSGGRIPGVPPDWPAASNLTPAPGAAIARWSDTEFAKTMRTGTTPEGRMLDQKYMPWRMLGKMTDEEMQAL
jgi:mono/diheme cytochrome c family protein